MLNRRFFLLVCLLMSMSVTGISFAQQEIGTLAPPLEFRDTSILNGETEPLAWQFGAPLPSFDPQDRPRLVRPNESERNH